MLCERADHFTGYNWCPVVVESRSSPAPASAASPIITDDTSVRGVSDRSRNRQHHRGRGINTATVLEVMVEEEVSAKGLADDRVEGMIYADRTTDHCRGMTDSALPKAVVVLPKIDRKGKSKAIDAYEQADPSRITEIVEPAPSGKVNDTSRSSSSTGSSADISPITTIDDDKTMRFTLGLIAPLKSILKRRASDSDITSSAIQSALMFITILSINVGQSKANHSLVIDVFFFVDLLFIIDLPRQVNREGVVHEHVDFDLFSFVLDSDVEVFVMLSLSGLFLMDKHDLATCVIMYDVGSVRRRIGGVYVPPTTKRHEWTVFKSPWVDCSFLMGDFSARQDE